MSRRWQLRAQDRLGAISRIEQYTAGAIFASCCADQRTVDAVIRNLEMIGEAARSLPADQTARYPAVPWRAIGATRNILIHACFNVNLEILW